MTELEVEPLPPSSTASTVSNVCVIAAAAGRGAARVNETSARQATRRCVIELFPLLHPSWSADFDVVASRRGSPCAKAPLPTRGARLRLHEPAGGSICAPRRGVLAADHAVRPRGLARGCATSRADRSECDQAAGPRGG